MTAPAALSRRVFLRHGAALGALLLGTGAAHGESQFPDRAVRMIVPYPPGGAGGVVAHLISDRLSKSLGQPLVIDERGGGAQIIATSLAVNAPPDGYTLFLASTTHSINPSLFAHLPYDTLNDFAPITVVASSPLVFLAHPSLGISTIQELVARAKAQPGKINYGSGGPGTGGHLSVERLKAMAGIDMVHVPYKGAGPLLNDFLGGQVQVVCTSPLPTMPFVKQGRLKALAMTSARRSPIAPDLPTVAESGYPGYESTLWYALLTQARTPPAVRDRLYEAAIQTLRDPEVVARFRAQGAEAVGNTPQQADAFIRSEIDQWGKLISLIGLKGTA